MRWTTAFVSIFHEISDYKYTGCSTGDADKSLARPGRKQTTTTEDFDVHITYL
jgi:hypothetical protein